LIEKSHVSHGYTPKEIAAARFAASGDLLAARYAQRRESRAGKLDL